ncbi:MAG: pyridoxamine 5'-phosphate oxidase [Fimbriimonadaceae bacterium]
MRFDYEGSGSVPEGATPWEVLEAWIEEARTAGSPEPEAMCLATSGDSGPGARFVLLRGLAEDGLRFFTNYESRKGTDLAHDDRCEACFWWPEIERQVRVRGRAAKLAASESDAYFASRPLESRFSAAASPQSREIAGRAVLEQAVERLAREFPAGPSRPADWGGYLLSPDAWEFWIGRPGRLHERHAFFRQGTSWQRSFLAP